MPEQEQRYTRDALIDGSFEEVRDRAVDALAEEGFGVMWEVDAKATFDEKLGKSFREYLILGACAPELAYEALGEERRLGTLLPCNVVIQAAEDDQIEVNIIDPVEHMGIVPNQALDPIIDEVGERLDRALDAIAAA